MAHRLAARPNMPHVEFETSTIVQTVRRDQGGDPRGGSFSVPNAAAKLGVRSASRDHMRVRQPRATATVARLCAAANREARPDQDHACARRAGRRPGAVLGWRVGAGVAGVLDEVQIDHTVVDVIVVDERHRLPIGRPYVTVAIDVCSRCILDLVVTLEAPSALSVGLCLAHAVTDKRPGLERLEVECDWPMAGKPRQVDVANASEFKSEAVRGEQHAIHLRAGRPANRTSAG